MNPYDRTTRDGKTIDLLTDAALRTAEKDLGYALTITQGSYNAGKVAASEGTHDAGGVVDLLAWDWENKVTALRRVGFAAWYRPELWRDGVRVWPAHIHAVVIGHPLLAPAAARQVAAYKQRRDGLAGNRPDTDPGWTAAARFDWPTFLADQTLRADLYAAQQAAAKAGRTGLRARLDRIRRRIGVPR